MSDQPLKDRVRGSYEVWHDKDWPASKFGHICGEESETPFPEGFTRVAVVEASSLDQVLAMMNPTNDVGNSREPNADVPQQIGLDNEGEEAYMLGPRVTTFGDVIVDPLGTTYRVECTGIEPFASSEQEADSQDRHLEGAADRGAGCSKEIDWEPER
jgi:hypothetical protein